MLSLAPTTAGPTTPGMTTESTVAVMYPKDMVNFSFYPNICITLFSIYLSIYLLQEDACKSSVATMTAVIFAVLAPMHSVVMYATFIKLEKMFSPSRVNAGARHKLRMNRIMRS